MAKETKKAKDNLKPEFPHRTANSIWADSAEFGRLSTLTGWRIFFSSMVEVKGLPHRFSDFGRHDFMQILISEAGQGKTTIPKQICKRNGIDFFSATHSGVQVEDWLPQTMNLIDEETKQPIRAGYGPMWNDYDKRACFLIDDTMSADAQQQGQIRSILTHHNLSGLKLGKNIWTVGATNPATVNYMSNKPFDHSLEKRIFFVPVEMSFDDWMTYAGGTNPAYHIVVPDAAPKEVPLTPFDPDTGAGALYEPLYMWLRQEGGDGELGFRHAADFRRWTNISDGITRMLASGMVTMEEMFLWMRFVLPDEVVGAFSNFHKKGTDPDEYMIPARRLLGANKTDHDTHMNRIKRWQNHATRNILTNFTTYDLLGHLRHKQPESGSKTVLNAVERANLKDYMMIVDDHSTANILENMRGQVADECWQLIRGTKKEDALGELIQKMDQIESMR